MRCALKGALLPLIAAAVLQAQVSPPHVGLTRFGDGTVRAVFGLPGNLIVGRNVLFQADAAAFSNSAGLVADHGHIQLVDSTSSVLGDFDSAEASPVLSVLSGTESAIIWLPSLQTLVYWNGKSFVQVNASAAALPGKVSSLLKQGSSAQLMLELPDGAVMQAAVSLDNGNLISLQPCPGITGPAYRAGNLLMFGDKNGLEAQLPNGSVQNLLPARESWVIEPMSSNWLHIRSSATGEDWAFQTIGSEVHVSRLPVPPSDSASAEESK